ncbi:MAG TPA: SH3 domain-containing protein [Acidobacteriaceae bacterium]|nr:SH3 domain-containing protein [Acidobacteriaceae bacterium]
MPTLRFHRNTRRANAAPGLFRNLLWLLLPVLLAGCGRFHPIQKEYVYVSARQVYLHDRVAAVSNRTALVTNGEALEVIEQGKRFVKVRTPKGEVGWLEDHAVIDGKLYAQFQDLTKKHAEDPVEANGELRDDLYLHVKPGRETAHFLLIPGSTKVQLLDRGSIAKAPAPGVAVAKPKTAVAADTAAVPQPVAMEDWWLVRDNSGHTGWLLANRVDVDVPDEVGQYGEGQRMIAAYPIAKVLDDGTGRERRKDGSFGRKRGKGVARPEAVPDATSDAVTAAPKEMTEYVTVLSPPRGGLPYDFDQVRVFTWSLNHHRYETAYRLHGIQGYLPVKISTENVNGQSEPTFSFEIASGPDVSVDPETGVTRPVAPRTIAFRLEGNIVKRTGADMAPIVLTRDPEEAAKAKAAAKKKRR